MKLILSPLEAFEFYKEFGFENAFCYQMKIEIQCRQVCNIRVNKSAYCHKLNLFKMDKNYYYHYVSLTIIIINVIKTTIINVQCVLNISRI